MFNWKRKKLKNINLGQPKDINFDHLVIGSFWSGKTITKTIFSESLSKDDKAYKK